MPRSIKSWVIIGGVLLVLLVLLPLLGWAYLKYPQYVIDKNEKAAIKALRAIAGAQNTWQRKNYDGNDVLDYAPNYRDLYYHEVDGKPVALIPKELADACGPDGKSYKGYLFGDLVGDATTGKSYSWQYEFGMCAWPAKYKRTGVHAFVADVTGVIYQDIDGRPTTRWPTSKSILVGGCISSVPDW